MNRFEYYKELYFKELERREHINQELNTPLSILTGLIVGIFFLATTFSYESSEASKILFWVILLLALLPLCASVYFLVLGFVDRKAFFQLWNVYEYKALPKTSEIRDWQLNLDRYYENLLGTNVGVAEASNEQFQTAMIDRLIEFTDHNIQRNDTKGYNIYNAKIFVIYSVLVSSLLVFPYGYSLYKKPKVYYKLIMDAKDSHRVSSQVSKTYQSINVRKTDTTAAARTSKYPTITPAATNSASGKIDKRRGPATENEK